MMPCVLALSLISILRIHGADDSPPISASQLIKLMIALLIRQLRKKGTWPHILGLRCGKERWLRKISP
jgi:hypothetical protein